MSHIQETDAMEGRYQFPKLKGDWEHSCSSSDPSESGSVYTSLASGDTSSERSRNTDAMRSQADTEEVKRNMRCTVVQKYISKRRSTDLFEFPEEIFPRQEISRSLLASSCIGQGSQYVILRSSDGHYFVMKRKYAYGSKTIRMFFSKTYPSKLNIMDFDFRMPSLTLYYVCKYLTYRFYYTKFSGVLHRPYFPIPPELALDLTVAGYMLKC